MACGHSFGLPPWEAPIMLAEKRKLFFSFSFPNANAQAILLSKVKQQDSA